MVEIRQGMRTLSEPTQNFRELVLTWAVSNAVTRQDANENIMLDKDKSTHRIDPIAALMNAHVRGMLLGKEQDKDLERHILGGGFSF